MYGIVAAYLSYLFKLTLGNRLFISYQRGAFKNSFCKLFLFNGLQNRGNLLLVGGIGGKLDLAVKCQKLYSALFGIFLFKFVYTGVHLFERATQFFNNKFYLNGFAGGKGNRLNYIRQIVQDPRPLNPFRDCV